MDDTHVPLAQISDWATRVNLTRCAYPELAMRRGLRLAAPDKKLIAAARGVKHPLLTEVG